MPKKNLDYWKKEFAKLPDSRLLANTKYLNTYDNYTSFAKEEGLGIKGTDALVEFVVGEILKRGLNIPARGYKDLIKIGYRLEKN